MASPEIVLQEMQNSYGARDSVGYTRLFDAAYLGESYDQSSGVPLRTFTWADEQRHIQALASKFSISRVTLGFSGLTQRFTDVNDPDGWATIQSGYADLHIFDGAEEVRAYSSDESIEFKFIPTFDTNSPTDTTWKIIKWTEIYTGSAPTTP